MKTLTIIPSRLSATRLPGKPLLKINNLSIISHVFKRAQEANIGDVIVAAEDQEIVDDVIKNGGRAILTGKNHKTGTDRVFEVANNLELKDEDIVINVQGDEPFTDPEDINNIFRAFFGSEENTDTQIKNLLAHEMTTLYSAHETVSPKNNPNQVKIKVDECISLDFSRKKRNFNYKKKEYFKQ